MAKYLVGAMIEGEDSFSTPPTIFPSSGEAISYLTYLHKNIKKHRPLKWRRLVTPIDYNQPDSVAEFAMIQPYGGKSLITKVVAKEEE